MLKRLVVGLAMVCLGMLGGAARGQSAPLTVSSAGADSASIDDVLHAMVRRAGVMFVGTVLEVRRLTPARGGAGVVEVEFAVQRGIRGAVTGRSYVLREWAGLWEGTDERYRVGDQRLMLLHAPGAGGLSSPVSGMDGALPIRPGGSANASAAGTSTVAEPVVEPVVDLRWVAARVSHGPIAYRAERPQIPRARPMAEVLRLPGTVTPVESGEDVVSTPAVTDRSVASQCASVSQVVAAIERWGAAAQ